MAAVIWLVLGLIMRRYADQAYDDDILLLAGLIFLIVQPAQILEICDRLTMIPNNKSSLYASVASVILQQDYQDRVQSN